MKSSIKSALFYILSLAVSITLIYYVYRNQSLEEMLHLLKDVDVRFLLFSVLISLGSHLSRAHRWTIALQPLGYKVNVFRAYLAVMVGYFANLIFPRMGEVSRCVILERTDNVPSSTSFGTVLTERAIDSIFLLGFIATMVYLQFDRIGSFILGYTNQIEVPSANKIGIVLLIFLLGISTFILFLRFRSYWMQYPILQKIYVFIDSLKIGLLSIFKLKTKHAVIYITQTFLIWIQYYLMTYVLFFSSEATSSLGLGCALSAFVLGGLGIAMPVPGGIGVYHAFVAQALMGCGLTEVMGKSFAALAHSVLTSGIILVGGLSLGISFLIAAKARKLTKISAQENNTETTNTLV